MGSIVKWSALATALGLSAAPVFAEANGGPWTNLPVCTALGFRAGPKAISGGANGAIVAWYDFRNNEGSESNADVYIQSLNAGGIPEWTPGGLPLCMAPGDQFNVGLASDGDGGAIAAWTDYRDPLEFIYAQRVDRRGQVKWALNGINIAPSQDGANPRVEADGSGGAFVAWEALGVSGVGIFAQHVGSDGRLLWGAGGVGVNIAAGYHYGPSVRTDGAGGAIFVWTDRRGPAERVFGQHLDAHGNPLWTPNGIPLCGFNSEQRFAVAVGDGAGGAIAVWMDSRHGAADKLDVFAERVDGTGKVLWDPSGVGLCASAGGVAGFPVAIGNGGGAIVAWHDQRSGDFDVRAQSVSASGRALWEANGVAVCIAPNDQVYPAITSDEAGGAFVGWSDYRAVKRAIFVQHVSADGNVQWGPSGEQIGVPAGASTDEPVVAADGRRGAFVAWTDYASWPVTVDVVAERITSAGPNGRAADGTGGRKILLPIETLVPGTGQVTVRLSVTGGTRMRVTVYDVSGRRVRGLIDGYLEAGDHVLRWDALDESGRQVNSGVYFVRAQSDEWTTTARCVVAR